MAYSFQIFEYPLYLSHVILPRLSREGQTLVVLVLTHMVVEWYHCYVKVTSSCYIASQVFRDWRKQKRDPINGKKKIYYSCEGGTTMFQGEHSALFLTFIKLPNGLKAFAFCLFLSRRFTQAFCIMLSLLYKQHCPKIYYQEKLRSIWTK